MRRLTGLRPPTGILAIGLLLTACAFAGAQADDDVPGAKPDRVKDGFKLTIDLRDGTRIVGRAALASIKLYVTGKEKTEIPLAQVKDIALADDRETAVVRREKGETLSGVLDLQQIDVESAIGPVTVPINNVRAVSGRTFEPTTSPAAVKRLLNDAAFPQSATRVDFTTDPDGNKLTVGQDVGATFIPLGFTVATSIKGAIVSVNTYTVAGPSGGLSCATHQPLWEGILTIRFCLPGNDRIAAGVNRVGFWIAHVFPNGTKVEAYDARDRLIASYSTTKNGSEFLGIETGEQIAYLKIVPNVQIDPNYTIDDLVFDTPRPLANSGDRARFVVRLRTGDWLRCRAAAPEGKSVRLVGVSIGIESVAVPLSNVAGVVFPIDAKGEPVPLADSFWLKLADGSVLRGRRTGLTGSGSVRAVRLPDEKLDETNLAALWGEKTPYAEPSDAKLPAAGHVVVITAAGRRHVAEWEFGENRVLTFDQEPSADPPTYQTSPVVWFRPVPRASEKNGRLNLRSGESFILKAVGGAEGRPDGAGHFVLKSWTKAGVVLAHRDRTLRIPRNEMLSLTLPTAAHQRREGDGGSR